MLQWHLVPLASCAPRLQVMLSKDSLQRIYPKGALSLKDTTFPGNSSPRRGTQIFDEWLNDKITSMSPSIVKPLALFPCPRQLSGVPSPFFLQAPCVASLPLSCKTTPTPLSSGFPLTLHLTAGALNLLFPRHTPHPTPDTRPRVLQTCMYAVSEHACLSTY